MRIPFIKKKRAPTPTQENHLDKRIAEAEAKEDRARRELQRAKDALRSWRPVARQPAK